MTFDILGLSSDLLANVAREGYVEPTPVQASAIPLILAGRDVIATAQTGTGKTAAFVLPILERLRVHGNVTHSPARHPVRVLILTPTRELAMQIAQAVGTYGHGSPLRSTAVYGGTRMDAETRALWAGVEILVATPGRLLDHITQRSVNLGQVEVLVLDEADRMLDMGFIPDVRRIVAHIPDARQTLLFSATLSSDVRRLAGEFMRDPATVEVAPRNSVADNLTEVLYPVDGEGKVDLLVHLIERDGMRQVLVFTRTKSGASRLASSLERRGLGAAAIHGDRTQAERIRALAAFKQGFVPVLVATDVASRGLDIEGLPYVVNYELPRVPHDYVHRIGRTGRAGASGTAISLVSPEEVDQLRAIQRLLRRAIPVETVAEYLPGTRRPAQPRPSGSIRRTKSFVRPWTAAGDGRGSSGRSLTRAGRPVPSTDSRESHAKA